MTPPDPHAALNRLTTAIAAGVLLIIVAQRVKFPAIVLLLFGGVALRHGAGKIRAGRAKYP